MNPYYLFITFLEFSFSRSHLSFAYLLVAKISIPVFVDFYSHLLTSTFHVFLLIITWYVHVLHFFPFILSTFIYRCTTICPFNYPASSPFIWYLHIRFFPYVQSAFIGPIWVLSLILRFRATITISQSLSLPSYPLPCQFPILIFLLLSSPFTCRPKDILFHPPPFASFHPRPHQPSSYFFHSSLLLALDGNIFTISSTYPDSSSYRLSYFP